MRVSEIMRKILAPHGRVERDSGEFTGKFRQHEFATVLGIDQTMVSDWKRATPTSDIQLSWERWLRLFTYCQDELGMGPRFGGNGSTVTSDVNKEQKKSLDNHGPPEIVSSILSRIGNLKGLTKKEATHITRTLEELNAKYQHDENGKKPKTGRSSSISKDNNPSDRPKRSVRRRAGHHR
jgi:hypothetical protein